MKQISSIQGCELYCNQHHKQIKWLCLNPHCNQPFCQECLSNHSLTHEKVGTRPMLRQINDLKRQTEQLIQKYQQDFSNQQQSQQTNNIEVLQIQNKINGWVNKVQKNIKETKEKCLNLVQRKFQAYQQWLKKTIKKQKNMLSSKIKLKSKAQHTQKKKQFFQKFENISTSSKDEFIRCYALIKTNLLEMLSLEDAIYSEIQFWQNQIDKHLSEIQKHHENCLEQFETKLTHIIGYLETNNQDQINDKTKNSKSCLKKSTQLQQNAKVVKWAWPVKQSVNKQQLGRGSPKMQNQNREPLKQIHISINQQQFDQISKNASPKTHNMKTFFYNNRAGEHPQQYHINFHKMSQQVNYQPGFKYQQNRQPIYLNRLDDSPKMNYTYPIPGCK